MYSKKWWRIFNHEKLLNSMPQDIHNLVPRCSFRATNFVTDEGLDIETF